MKTKIFLSVFALFASISISAQYIGDGNAVSRNFTNSYNGILTSGIYTTGNPQAGYPSTNTPYTYLFTMYSPNSTANANYQFQISSTMDNDDRVFFRKLRSTKDNSTWKEFATRGSNTFTGTQTMPGEGVKLSLGGFGNANDQISFSAWGTPKSDLYVTYGNSVLFKNHTNPSTGYIVFSNTGNVGIGTLTTTNYKLSVNGTIRAKEIIVESGWADFVFAADYKLPTLTEVKAHIDEHKHLPGIPSEAEVKENGVGLADMTTKLLQKVEELTLYAIDQQETISKLNGTVEVLNKKIEDLENAKK